MKALGVDPGSRRLGLALSDETGTIATPLGVLKSVGDVRADAREIVKVAEQNGAQVIVIGFPREMDGSEGASAKSSRALAESVRAVSDLEVQLVDERFSTVVAENLLAMAEDRRRPRSRDVKSGRVDAAAAAVLLQSWLDGRKARGR